MKKEATPEKIKQLIRKEFKNHWNEFEFSSYPVTDAQIQGNSSLEQAGVYVYWRHNEVIKVGKSNVNARKRACEHLWDNTISKDGTLEMKNLKNDPETFILFFI